MNAEPLWRTVLCWGIVVTYLTVPLVVLLIHLNASPDLDYRLTHNPTGFIRDFYVSVTGILVSLAGLNTYQAVAFKRDDTKREAKKE